MTAAMVAAARARAVSGTVALEMGLLASAFLSLTLGVVELGFLLFAQVSLDYAANQAARQLLTGQVHVVAGTGQTAFQSADFCTFLSPLITCTGVAIVLTPVVNYQTTLSTQTAPNAGTTVNPGGSGSLMLLQAYYTPGLPLWPLNLATLVSSAAFVNE